MLVYSSHEPANKVKTIFLIWFGTLSASSIHYLWTVKMIFKKKTEKNKNNFKKPVCRAFKGG
ncbi:hypothetical protein A7985_12955 [Pseudoalteromonas luteoviolacea]|uniref:Uncharacterized protein n=1 Tax=Pseudoalteromonas luteoviolacea TaxID=43657 RepID=A0A1C0TRD8_9GAMM|nr:hypothetical protein A7985_12955 [Pseudoalteromonas luteoviolacea]